MKKRYLVFVPVPGTELQKVLVFPGWQECLCYASEVTLMGLRELQDGTGHQIDQPRDLDVGMFSCPTLREGNGAGHWVPLPGQRFNQQYPYNETPVKSLDMKAKRLSGASWLVNTLMCYESDMPVFHREGIEVLCFPPSPIIALCWSCIVWLR